MGAGEKILHLLDTVGGAVMHDAARPPGTEELLPAAESLGGGSSQLAPCSGPTASLGAASSAVTLPALRSPRPLTGCCGCLKVQPPRSSWGHSSSRVPPNPLGCRAGPLGPPLSGPAALISPRDSDSRSSKRPASESPPKCWLPG